MIAEIAKPFCRVALIAAVVVSAALTSAMAADEVQPWEAGLGIGMVDPGNKRNLDNGMAGLLTLGHRFNEKWGAELFGIIGSNDASGSGSNSDLTLIGARGFYHFNDVAKLWTPYLSFGAGNTRFNPGRNELSGIVGAGLKHELLKNVALRAELNAHYGVDSKAADLSAFVGLIYQWGAKPGPAPVPEPVAAIDSDHDGVPDNLDKCPNTPAGVKVDASGCPIDSDGDGVPDHLDKCPNTPAGVKVNANGCPIDSDGDGVPDYLDKCPNTPTGVKVNASGCPIDSDGDGVPDYLDKCPDTPKGARVNSDGCPVDSDGDGVPDYLDKCPDTPAGVKVNASGCPIDSDGDGVPDYLDQCPNTPVGIKVNVDGCALDADGDGVPDYLDKCPDTPKGVKVDASGCPIDSDGDGVADNLDKCPDTPKGAKVDAKGCTLKLTEKVSITLKLNFDTNKATIKTEFGPEIKRVADFMRQYPGTTVVIEGHTDNVGDDDYNLKLSRRRAEAVALTLIQDYGIAPGRVQALGYGPARPIADNKTVQGRAENRRVTAVIEETVAREVK